jgi:hypothetical protein
VADVFTFHEQWRRLADKAFGQGYENLTPDEKVWFNVQSLIQTLHDGGLISFYYNDGANHVGDCVVALDRIGAHEFRRLVDRVSGLFPGGVPNTTSERNAIIDSWPDGTVDDLLSAIDTEAAAFAGGTEDRLARFLEKSGVARP